MRIYKYDVNTKEYLGYMEAYLDPLETVKQKRDVYVIPPNFTTIKPEQPKDDSTVIFNGKEWVMVEDNRGLKVYDKKSSKELVITELGAIPEGYSLEKPIFLEDLRTDCIGAINKAADEARRKVYVIKGIEGSVEILPELMKHLDEFGSFNVINIVQGNEDVQVTKEELEEAIKNLYIRSMLIPRRKKELLKEVNSCRSKSKLQEFVPNFNIEKEVNKLMKLTVEELNEEFSK